ncbi:putative bifunctional diguanylate cyclase/phosphodiesterase [Ectobacillus ponti]|uniref:EAL domain-containing protein n=2 Tax=Bacteria TaxID=2 RepID=A0AA41XCA7_9BACI|nr:EAL domain-containing protein [Ectobacillus ponti]MCP8970699.1 EAL domain-containing protein [Ectobacillus ponti]
MFEKRLLRSQNQILRMVAQGANCLEALQALTCSVEELCPHLHCSILLFDQEKGILHSPIGASLPLGYRKAIDGIKAGIMEGSCGRACYLKQSIIVPDIQTSPFWSKYRDAALSHGYRACWSAPIFASEGRVLGTFALYYSETGSPGNEELEAMDVFSSLAGVILEKWYNEAQYKIVSESLQASEEKYRLMAEHMTDCLAIINMEGDILYASPSHELLIGVPAHILEKSNVFDWIAADDVLFVTNSLRNIMKGKAQSMEYRVRHRDGHMLYVETRATLMQDGRGRPDGILSVTRDITERKQFEQKIEQLAYQDALTRLPNRHCFMQRMPEMMKQAQESRTSLAVMFLDFDRMKWVNDFLGHAAGDQVISHIAKRIRDALPDSCLLSRWGGDEFVLVYPNAALPQAKQLAERLLEAIAQPVHYLDLELILTASIGIALYEGNSCAADDLIHQADLAMYAAKENGKHTYIVYSTDLEQSGMKKIVLEGELRKAIEREEFVMHYQPQVDASGKPIGLEALIRWNHPLHGFISPAEFIPLAEETGLIIPLGNWVIEHVCGQLQQWQPQNIHVSLNLSTKQLQDPELPRTVQKALQTCGIPPALLELEITESAIMRNVTESMAILEQLKQLGVQLSIDDFGVSYSSLNYLKQFPIDKIKIDRAFIREIHTDRKDYEIVSTIIHLAHNLNLQVLAEGVEVQEQYHTLQRMDCNEYQGYYFSKPLPPEELDAFLSARTPI